MADTTRTGVFDFVREVIEQIKKVTWPDQAQLQNSTMIIVVFMFLCGAIILAMDLGVAGLLKLLTSLFTG
ncbi:MAG: SecE/Sec61-gamma subunit of protein translocation complex [Gemmatimonadetes bacterium]|nr:SecE/Sec61-gamma subunit of protein translocation complex [Gemmatimonadota bacterium]